jgi:hypothetical protein
MKRNLFYSFALLLLLASKANAQHESTLWIDLITGVNSTWILNQNTYGNPEFEYATTFGFTGGLGTKYIFSDKWGFGASALVSMLGQDYSGIQSEGDAKRKVKLTYLEVPLTMMRVIPYKKYQTWISFGPSVMVLLNAQQQYHRNGGLPLPNPDGMKVGDIRKRFNSTDVGLSIALNKLFKLNDSGNSYFVVSFNGVFGLTDINSIEWQIPNMHGVYGSSHNFYVGVKGGLMFNASKE